VSKETYTKRPEHLVALGSVRVVIEQPRRRRPRARQSRVVVMRLECYPHLNGPCAQSRVNAQASARTAAASLGVGAMLRWHKEWPEAMRPYIYVCIDKGARGVQQQHGEVREAESNGAEQGLY